MVHPAAICSRRRDKRFEFGISGDFCTGTSGPHHYPQSLPIFPDRAKLFFISPQFVAAASPVGRLSATVVVSVFRSWDVFFGPIYFESVRDFCGPEAESAVPADVGCSEGDG
jgi:hypothetical protein